LFDHAGAALAIERGKIWRQLGVALGRRAGSESQFLKKRAKRQVVLLHAGEPFLEINPENVTRALGIRLGVDRRTDFSDRFIGGEPAARKTASGQRCK
jgi:predicted RNA binding protein YcfA (HicA-like mRNA interferase family)